jgi:hypothetical protein
MDLCGAARRIPDMRGTRALLVAILVGVAVLAPRSLGESATRACASPLPCSGVRLPAPITIAAGRVLGADTYRIARDGRVRRAASPQSPFPRGAAWFPGTGTWYTIQRAHLVVGRGKRPLWTSHGEIAANQLGVIAASSHAVAFQHNHKLYLAQLGGAERAIARRELPLGWTTGGLFTYRYQGRQLLLRSNSGALVKVIARRPLGSDYSVTNGTLYFIARSVLMSVHGTRIARLASLSSLGLSANPWLQPLGRLVELQDDHRLVVVRADGTVFASTPLPVGHNQSESLSSSLVVAPHLTAVAFTTASRRTGDPRTGRSRGTETAYVLPAGASAGIPVHRENVQFAVCERGASLEWLGKWLLYSNTEGSLAAIDTTGPHHAIKLRSLVKRLPGARNGFTAYWSGQPS